MKFKKIISLLTTMMVAAAPICSTSYVNATSDSSSTYLVGDINGNGVVDITDLPLMMQFLRGSLSADARTAERLDVNYDNIINKADYDNLVDRFFTNNLSSTRSYPSYLTSLPAQKNDNINGNTGVKYSVYSAVTGTSVTSYRLNPVDEINTNSSRGIIGSDDRELESGLDGVINVRLNGSNYGTAFAVDDHTLLTAAHVLYHKDGSSAYVPSNLKFYIVDENNNSTEIHAQYYHIPTYFIQNAYTGIPANENRQNADAFKYDYAIVTVSEQLPVNFHLGVPKHNFTTSDLKVTGFGGDGTNVNDENIDVKTTGSGALINNNDDEYTLKYYTDTVGGDSGGPVYVLDVDDNESRTAIAINHVEFFRRSDHTNLYNQGVKITTDILHFVYNNSHV